MIWLLNCYNFLCCALYHTYDKLIWRGIYVTYQNLWLWILICLVFCKNVYFYIICDFNIVELDFFVINSFIEWGIWKQCYLTFWAFSGLSKSMVAQILDLLCVIVFNKRNVYFKFACRRVQYCVCVCLRHAANLRSATYNRALIWSSELYLL